MTNPAVFFDGKSSRRRLVTLVFAEQLQIADAANPALLAAWPYEAVRRVDGADQALRLACTAGPPLARLELRDPAVEAQVRWFCPMLDGPGSAARVSVARIVLASLAAAVAIFSMAWFGMPLLADRVAAVIPYGWEKPLGDAVDPRVRSFFGKPCTGKDGAAALGKLVARLQGAARLPLDPNPVVLRSAVPNAFALPGGRVYVLSGLLKVAATPDELAGVLSHEFGHVMHRDGLRRLVRDGGTSFLVGLMFGDVTGAGAVLMAGQAVLSARYSRGDETRADQFAATVMHRLGRPTAPLGDLLLRITGAGHGGIPSLLADHPLSPDRKAMLEAGDTPPTGPALLEPAEWEALKHICDN